MNLPFPPPPIRSSVDLAKRRNSQPNASSDNGKGLTWPLRVSNVSTTVLQVTAQETNMHPSKYGAINLKLQVSAGFSSLQTKTETLGPLILFLLCPYMPNSYNSKYKAISHYPNENI